MCINIYIYIYIYVLAYSDEMLIGVKNTFLDGFLDAPYPDVPRGHRSQSWSPGCHTQAALRSAALRAK